MTLEERMFERLRHKAIAIRYRAWNDESYIKEKVWIINNLDSEDSATVIWMFDPINQRLLWNILDFDERGYYKKDFFWVYCVPPREDDPRGV